MPSKLLKLNSVAVSRPSALLSYTLSCFLNPDYLKKLKKKLKIWMSDQLECKDFY